MPQLGTMMPHKEREESIPSIHLDANESLSLAQMIGARHVSTMLSRLVVLTILGSSAATASACVPARYVTQCATVSEDQCLLGYWKSASIVVLARVRRSYTEPFLVYRSPAHGATSQYTYAELEILEQLKGVPLTTYVARVAYSLSSCAGDGPFVEDQVGLYAIEQSVFESPAVFHKYKEGEVPRSEKYSFAMQWPKRFLTPETASKLRKLADTSTSNPWFEGDAIRRSAPNGAPRPAR